MRDVFSPTISATPFSPTVGATPKILSATPYFEVHQPSVYKHYLYCMQVGNCTQNHHISCTSMGLITFSS